jgi:hypothetical protein
MFAYRLAPAAVLLLPPLRQPGELLCRIAIRVRTRVRISKGNSITNRTNKVDGKDGKVRANKTNRDGKARANRIKDATRAAVNNPAETWTKVAGRTAIARSREANKCGASRRARRLASFGEAGPGVIE